MTALLSVTSAEAQVVTGNARYVDPFIGVDGGGNVFREHVLHLEW